MNLREFTRIVLGLIVLGSLVIWSATAVAYTTYSGCRQCHPGFQGGPGSGPLHELHTQMTSTCLLCHTSIGDTPRTYVSGAAQGQGCRGCHGVDNGTQFEWAAGLREHHRAAGIPNCQSCHTDSPSSILPESTVPVYYPRTGVNISDPCVSARPEGEDFDNDGRGLDNDGDLAYDESDSDCSTTGIDDHPVGSLPQLMLQSIAPNPAFAGGVDVVYSMSRTSDVVLRIYDSAGRYVLEKTFSGVESGVHRFHFDGKVNGRQLPSGVYAVQIQSNGAIVSGRFTLVR